MDRSQDTIVLLTSLRYCGSDFTSSMLWPYWFGSPPQVLGIQQQILYTQQHALCFCLCSSSCLWQAAMHGGQNPKAVSMQSRAISSLHTCTSSYNVNVSLVQIQIDTNSLVLFLLCIYLRRAWCRPQFPVEFFQVSEGHGQHKHDQVSRHLCCHEIV